MKPTIYSERLSIFINERTDLPENNIYYLCDNAEMLAETHYIY
jgi:hypothetical protein